MLRITWLALIFCFIPVFSFAVEITPSQVYREVQKIHDEIEIIKKHLGIDKAYDETETHRINTDIKPHHVWQKGYLVLVKINVLRRNLKYPRIEEVGIEPMIKLPSGLVYGLTQRILTELRIIKDFEGIKETIGETPRFEQKKPSDVFNFLHHVSFEMDILNGSQAMPSDTYAQTRRLYDDIDAILAHQEVPDKTIPPAKNNNATPIEEYQAAFELLDLVQGVARKIGLEVTDFSSFKTEAPEPSDVMNLVSIILAELQPIKATLGMTNDVTPPAKHFRGKIRGDVEQVLRWNVERIKLLLDSGKF